MTWGDLTNKFKQFVSGISKVDDVKEHDDYYQASFMVPGYAKDQINVYVEHNSLIVEGIKDKEAYEKAKKKHEKKHEEINLKESGDKSSTQDEKSSTQDQKSSTQDQKSAHEQKQEDKHTPPQGSDKNFKWSYPVPLDVDASKITGEVKDGVLVMTLPKKQVGQEKKQDVKIS